MPEHNRDDARYWADRAVDDPAAALALVYALADIADAIRDHAEVVRETAPNPIDLPEDG